MGWWIQIGFDIFIVLGFLSFAARLTRRREDDARISRGLQILQAKISVLEDLADRTDAQVQQNLNLMDQKLNQVQKHMTDADRHVEAIHSAMKKSLEVAKIFQEQLPIGEIVERQNTLKYLKAAKLAHQGRSVGEICAEIDLPQAEIELIIQVNRENLIFTEDTLPEWAKAGLQDSSQDKQKQAKTEAVASLFQITTENQAQALAAEPTSHLTPAPTSVSTPAPVPVPTVDAAAVVTEDLQSVADGTEQRDVVEPSSDMISPLQQSPLANLEWSKASQEETQIISPEQNHLINLASQQAVLRATEEFQRQMSALLMRGIAMQNEVQKEIHQGENNKAGSKSSVNNIINNSSSRNNAKGRESNAIRRFEFRRLKPEEQKFIATNSTTTSQTPGQSV